MYTLTVQLYSAVGRGRAGPRRRGGSECAVRWGRGWDATSSSGLGSSFVLRAPLSDL